MTPQQTTGNPHAAVRTRTTPVDQDGSGPQDERAARVTWSVIAEPGDAVAFHACNQLGHVEALRWARQASAPELLRRLGGEIPRTGTSPESRSVDPAVRVGDAVRRWRRRLQEVDPEQVHDRARAMGMRVLVPGDPQWPDGLEDLGEATPHCLWVHGPGDLAALVDQGSVAMVGSRASTPYGQDCARSLAAGVAGHGHTIVSGGAYGIDAAAHRGALTATEGATVAVLAGGLDRLYPAGNTGLLEAIRARHLVVGEAPPGTAPTRWRFLARNRLIAALSQVTVVVEAGWRSGALSTARHAYGLKRVVAAVPGPVTSPASAGCHLLLREGETVLVTEAQDVRELLRGAPAAGESRFAEQDALDLLEVGDRQVLDAVPTRSWTTSGHIASEIGWEQPAVLAALARLQLMGLVEPVGTREGRFRRCPTPPADGPGATSGIPGRAPARLTA